MIRYIFQSLLPGFLLIILAFVSGFHKQPLFALAGFLSFFVIGVTVIIEGSKAR